MIQTKTIQRFPNYTIGSDGRVFSQRSNKYLKPQKSNGYNYVNFYVGKKKIVAYIHHLVLEYFVGPRPMGMEACHNNGRRDDSRLENLRWDTAENNAQDKKYHGTYHCGEKVNGAKLNEFQVRRIRLMKEISPNLSNAKLAKIFNVSSENIWALLNGLSWKHI